MLQSSKVVAHPVGFEPTTPGFVDRCSNPTELRVHWICRARHYLEGPRRRQGKHLARRHMAKLPGLCHHLPMQSEKRFHGWRLVGVLALVIVSLAAVSFVVDWVVIGPLDGRLL